MKQGNAGPSGYSRSVASRFDALSEHHHIIDEIHIGRLAVSEPDSCRLGLGSSRITLYRYLPQAHAALGAQVEQAA